MLPFPSEAVFGWSSGAEAPPLDSALVERHRQLATPTPSEESEHPHLPPAAPYEPATEISRQIWLRTRNAATGRQAGSRGLCQK